MIYLYIFLYLLAAFATTVVSIRIKNTRDFGAVEATVVGILWPLVLAVAIIWGIAYLWSSLAMKVAGR